MGEDNRRSSFDRRASQEIGAVASIRGRKRKSEYKARGGPKRSPIRFGSTAK